MRSLRVLIASLLFAAWAPALPAQQTLPLRIYFFDVGQGDGILIQSPSGQNVVYDAGENTARMRDYLTALGVSRVDLVIASHNHADHIGGLPEVLRTFAPTYYIDNAVPTTTQAYANVIQAAAAAGSQLLEPTARRIALGDVSVVIVPPPGIPSWDQNDNSIGVVVEYGSFRLSLAGDAEPREWSWWNINQRDWLTPVQVHKASHHGSSNGDTAAGLASLSPEAVIVGVGQGNSYGHPDASALRLYGEAGATVYRTDTNGTVIVEAQSSGAYTVRVERGEGAQPPPSTTPSPTPTPSPSPAPAPAPAPTTYTLSGTIQDGTSSAALTEVGVRISDGANANRSTTTNGSGAYSLSSLASGTFTVAFSKSGYTTVSRAVALTQNTTLSLSLSRTVATQHPRRAFESARPARTAQAVKPPAAVPVPAMAELHVGDTATARAPIPDRAASTLTSCDHRR